MEGFSKAKSGAADFYIYILELEECKIVWVDDWASRDPIPTEIVELQHLFKETSTGF